MPVHHTPTDMGGWDAGAMLQRMGDEPGAAALKAMHAWMDPEGDPETKAAYKLPHHMVSEAGEVGAANMTACSAGIAALNGARGGVDIPDGDRAAVHRHLAAHMMDADMEPPELKSRAGRSAVERRAFTLTEIRFEEPGEGAPPTPPRIVGHAAVFMQPSEEMWGMAEQIAPGAFTKTIKEGDVRALWNHNADYVLGRTKSGTLKLAEDHVGLAISIDPPDVQWARDLMVTMKRGDVDQMSFAFRAVKETFDEAAKPLPMRTLLEVQLYDVSPVTYPAYPQTDAGVRAILAQAGIDPEGLAGTLAKAERRASLGQLDRLMIQATIDALRSYLPDEPGRTAHSAGGEAQQAGRMKMLQRRLELARRAAG